MLLKPFSKIIEHRRIILLSLVVNFGALLFGYDSGIAGAAIVLPSFQDQFGIRGSKEKVAQISGNIVSILYGGAFFGAILTCYCSWRFGRRAALLVGCVFFVSGGVVQTASRTVSQIYVGRLLAGFGIGSVSQVCPLYVGECASKHHRSRAVGTFQMCLVTGGMLAYWIGYAASVRLSPTSDRQWIVPIGLQLLPGGLFTIGLFFVPESPRWLALNEVRNARGAVGPSPHPSKTDLQTNAVQIEKLPKEDVEVTSPPLEQPPSPEIGPQPGLVIEAGGEAQSQSPSSSPMEPNNVHLYGSLARRIFAPSSPRSTRNASEALCALAYIRREPLSSPTLRAEMAEIYAQLEEAEEERRNGKGKLSEQLKKMSVWKRLATGSFVGAWQIWTGQTAILYYAPTIFMSIGFSSRSTSLLASGVFTCLKVATTALALLTTVHRFGRVISMSVGGALQGILFFLIGILLATHPVDPNDASPDPPSFAMMGLIYIYVFVYSFTLGPLPWVYGSEIFPTHLRDAGHLVFVCLTWSNNFAVAKLTPLGFAGIGWVLWMIYGSFNLGGAFICWMICPETKGKTMEEIDIIFGAVTEEDRATNVQNASRQQQLANS